MFNLILRILLLILLILQILTLAHLLYTSHKNYKQNKAFWKKMHDQEEQLFNDLYIINDGIPEAKEELKNESKDKSL